MPYGCIDRQSAQAAQRRCKSSAGTMLGLIAATVPEPSRSLRAPLVQVRQVRLPIASGMAWRNAPNSSISSDRCLTPTSCTPTLNSIDRYGAPQSRMSNVNPAHHGIATPETCALEIFWRDIGGLDTSHFGPAAAPSLGVP